MNKLADVIAWYNNLTPESLNRLNELYHEQAQFQDPFNDVTGHAAIKEIFRHMFKTTHNPQFSIIEYHQTGETAWVSWIFEFGLFNKQQQIEGTSRLDFTTDGRVISHRDYWDGLALLQTIPIIGKLGHYLQRKMRAPQNQPGVL